MQLARWKEIASILFGTRPIADGTGAVTLIAPDRAVDAALVPLKVELSGTPRLKSVSVVVDNNPSPLVGWFHLGPAFAQPQTMKLRVRVNEFTLIHAVVETIDGRLLAVASYVQAAGGCSAPSTGESAEIAARIGQMQLHRTREPGTAVPAQLLISHPNYNGMQMDVSARSYTPARYLQTVSVRVGGQTVFDLESGISLSEDPAISFSYLPLGDGAVDVSASDSTRAVYSRHFDPL